MRFGNFIRTKRAEMNMSQERFAEEIGVHWQTIGNWENFKSSPPIDLAVDIVDCLGGTLLIFEDKEDARNEGFAVDNAVVKG